MTFVEEQRKVHGARYHVVYPVCTFEEMSINWKRIEDWCVGTFGPEQGSWWDEQPGRWFMNNTKFWFREEADKNWFLLRWS